MTRRICILLILLTAVLSFQGCGIYSFTGASYGTAKTVSVDYFQNRSTYVNADLSNTITEALKDRFVSQTPLTLVKSGGDLHFEGTITGYAISSVGIKSGETASLNRLTITLKVTFTNETAPENDFDKSYTRYSDYDVSSSFNSVESSLVEEITKQLIDDIFNDSVVNW
ncbi:MAG: LptE family protein [Bacteroidales bacterium]|nr:LptE family protein [Bacteroidales bacterium]MBQ5540825.1 LptE family protein [Bacteroidales bacterium]MBR4677304.1 LptE family protein [Bacteroidales bacterium]MEE3447349.1 LptE family protein [Bacteroidales bacterium]